MIVIVNYGMGNFGSVANMLKKIGANYIITSDLDTIRNAEKLILPGVGSFDTAISRIDKMGLREIILDLAINKKIPLLGICLGMQLLMDNSEEGSLLGLGLIKGKAFHFNHHLHNDLKVPHMGWNQVSINNLSPITVGYQDEIRFYFVHSYFVRVENETNSIMKCNYGIEFDAAVQKNNIFGAQFHPEKSHRFGMQFFKNFIEL
ncbi:imidazole glycerol phosphate synthase subunit HisH [Flavobacteriaceae bacterium]|nr:imidazole glycerol phosphate synthase subunit HisH [Flavobacteriaceae bacterium]